MGVKQGDALVSHWNHMVQGLTQSVDEFYVAVEEELRGASVEGLKSERVAIAESGLLSAKREYLQVRRKEHVFHICAAPFGSGFFVSWWLTEVRTGILAMLSGIPYIGFLFALIANAARPLTYYRVDTALMFQSVTHGAVLGALDRVLSVKGLRSLSDVERKPLMRDFFGQLGKSAA